VHLPFIDTDSKEYNMLGWKQKLEDLELDLDDSFPSTVL
jgi:hypothetical protein